MFAVTGYHPRLCLARHPCAGRLPVPVAASMNPSSRSHRGRRSSVGLGRASGDGDPGAPDAQFILNCAGVVHLAEPLAPVLVVLRRLHVSTALLMSPSAGRRRVRRAVRRWWLATSLGLSRHALHGGTPCLQLRVPAFQPTRACIEPAVLLGLAVLRHEELRGQRRDRLLPRGEDHRRERRVVVLCLAMGPTRAWSTAGSKSPPGNGLRCRRARPAIAPQGTGARPVHCQPRSAPRGP